MKTYTDQLLLGKLLNGHYKAIQVLSAGAFGDTYIAEDTWIEDNFQCVVKHLKPKSYHPEQSRTCKRQFTNEILTLNQLGVHDQIPQLFDCFEDDQGYYLVQELIVGKSLSEQLPISKDCDKRWSEIQCIEFLEDVLNILEFVHGQGFIHCDIKPNNLVKRSCDGKFVLIDFGTAQRIESNQSQPRVVPIHPSIAPVAIPCVGYIPAEQLRGQACPGSDLYALGMIAIQALTGLNPMQLEINSESGEVNWQHHVAVSDPIAELLNRLVRYDVKNRYYSATHVRIALKKLSIKRENQGVSKEELSKPLTSEFQQILPTAISQNDNELLSYIHKVSRLQVNNNIKIQTLEDCPINNEITKTKGYYAREVARACLPKLPPLLSGMGAGMATSNAMVISLGLYTLMHSAPSNPGLDLLERATEQYKAGNFNKAIALAEEIPVDSTTYKDSVAAKRKWRQEWNNAATQFQAVQDAFYEQRWRDVFEEARNLPNLDYWQLKIEPFIELAKPKLEAEAQHLLKQAYDQAIQKNFTAALALLKQIPKETSTGEQIQPKLLEYTQKQQIKAESLLQQAYHRAAKKDFNSALQYLAEIPEDTPAYQTAQNKVIEYSQKQDFQEQTQIQAQLNARFPKEEITSKAEIKVAKLDKKSKPSKPSTVINPGNQLKEVSPKPQLSPSSKTLNSGNKLKEVSPKLQPIRSTPVQR